MGNCRGEGIIVLEDCAEDARSAPSTITAELHYTDTGSGGSEHRLRTPSTNTTNGQKFATSQHLDMSRCWVALRCGKFVVELL